LVDSKKRTPSKRNPVTCVIPKALYLSVLYLCHRYRSDYVINLWSSCRALLEALLSFLSASSRCTFQIVVWLGSRFPEIMEGFLEFTLFATRLTHLLAR
jgi:hypothetical protein